MHEYERQDLVPRMSRLRSATRDAHDRIERALPLLDPGLTGAAYRRIVESFHGYYASLAQTCHEPALEQKLPLLRADLLALGGLEAAVPRCHDLPELASASQVLGMLYVVEGATLGGQVIRRHLASVLDLDQTNGAAFFVGYGAETGAIWKAFGMRVETAEAFDPHACIGAAIATFETLARWIVETS